MLHLNQNQGGKNQGGKNPTPPHRHSYPARPGRCLKMQKKGIFGNPHRKYFQATQKFAKYATHIAIAGIDFTTKITKKT